MRKPATALPRRAMRHGPGAPFQCQAAAYLEEYLDKIRLAVEGLDEEAFWWRPAPGTNSAANLVIHLTGNLSLWVLKSLGGRDYERHRAAEFTADHTAGKGELLAALEGVVEACGPVLEGLSEQDLGREVEVQGYRCDTFSAAFHAVEHMSYHTGQIVWIAKQALASRGDPLFEFYPQHRAE